MQSKYDEYWNTIKQPAIKSIKQVVSKGQPVIIKVNGLTSLGNRSTWYARGVLGTSLDPMAHGRSFNRFFSEIANKLNAKVTYTISKNGDMIKFAHIAETNNAPIV